MPILDKASELLQKAKGKLPGILTNVEATISGVSSYIRGNPLLSAGAVGAGSALVGSAVTASVIKRTTKKTRKKSKTKKRKRTKRKTTKRRKTKGKRRRYKYARTAGKRKDRSTRRIRMTKNGQPYIILKSGKARFIKKSSARRSRKLKGGRY